jgi:protein O-GlcNAc transferase
MTDAATRSSRREVASSASELFNRASDLYAAGMLDRAEALCREIVGVDGVHFEALHLLANVQLRLGRPTEALASNDRALAVRPRDATAYYNRGIILHGLRRLEEAVASFDRAVAIRADFAAALVNRGIALRQLRRFDEALMSYDMALAINPGHAHVLFSRGNVLRDLQRYDEALDSYRRAVAIKPDHAEALNNCGLTLHDLKRFAEAVASYDNVLSVRPDHAEAHRNRGAALGELGRFDEALASYDKALAVKPDHAEAWASRGDALQRLRRHHEALASYDKALSIKPEHAEAWNNRGLALWHLRRLEEALASYDKALAIEPDHAEALNNRGPALWDLKRCEEALASYDRALATRPGHAELLYNRGVMLQDLKRHEPAIADFARVLALNPQYKYLKGHLLHARLHCCDWSGYADELQRLAADVRVGTCASNPFAFLGLSATARDQLACARTWVRDKCPASPTPIWQGERYSHDKIRVAYLSADFHDHPMAQLMAGVFERHDGARFETIALSFTSEGQSAMRARLRGAFGCFIDVRHEDDHQVARRIRDLEIDIAVDLMGFTRDARSGIFALRPAPVQVNYLGLNATMGADYIDYIIADRYVIPERSRDCYGEKVVYLPDSFQGNDAMRPIGGTELTRSAAGLPDQGFVFCSFNNSYKITPTMFDIWMRLMRAVDGSVLWLMAGLNAAVERNLRREAEHRGVAADRLIFAPRASYAEYMAGFRLADLFLDTLPFNGCTTASDALWNGLPLVTVSGETFVSRMAGSLLRAVGLPELVTHSLADYEALALRLARDADALMAVKAKLAENRAACPLFDTDRFRRHLEVAYATMWERARRGEPPESFAVQPVD